MRIQKKLNKMTSGDGSVRYSNYFLFLNHYFRYNKQNSRNYFCCECCFFWFCNSNDYVILLIIK